MKGYSIYGTKMPSLYSYLKEEDSQSEYENYSILKNSIRQINEISEIASALGSVYIIDIVTFKPRRLSFFETITTIETEVRIRNEEDLVAVVNEVYKHHVVPLLRTKDSSSNITLEQVFLEEVSQSVLNKVDITFEEFKLLEVNSNNADDLLNKAYLDDSTNIYYNEIRKVYNKIKTRIEEGLYIPGEHSFLDNHDSITKKIIFDKFYNKIMKEKVRELVIPLVQDLINKKTIYYPKQFLEEDNINLQRLTIHQGQHRHTFMMVGAPASGKGTSFGMVTIDARRIGIDVKDMVKCNTDSYRSLVSNEKELGPQTTYHAAFNYDEAYLITKMVYKRIREKIQSSNGCPHVLIDSVYPTQEKINLGITGDKSKLHIYCVSVPVEVSLARASSRAVETGRYMDTSLLLKSHRDVSVNFHKIMANHKSKNIDYVLIDNNVPKGSFPTLTEEGDLSSKIIRVHDIAKLLNFLAKSSVNIEANARGSLYLQNQTNSPIEHFNALAKLGFQIDFTQEHVHKKLKVFNPERPLKSQLRIALEKQMNFVTSYNSIGKYKAKYKSKAKTPKYS